MRFSQIAGVIATGSLGVNAFLLPPTVSAVEAEAIRAIPSSKLFSDTQIGLPCTGCDVATLDTAGNVDGSALTNTVPNSLLFRVSIKEQQNAPDRLMINDVQIYPVEPQVEGFGATLKAEQVVIRNKAGSRRGPVVLGYMVGTENQRTAGPFDLVKVHFEVVQVRNKDVRIPALNIGLVQAASGKLMIARVEVADVGEPLAGQCNSALCRFKALIASKLSKLKGCMRKPKHSGSVPMVHTFPHHGPGPVAAVESSTAPIGRPSYADHGLPHHHQGPHHHGHGHGHRRPSGVARFLRNFVFHVLIPILLGVAMGIAASLVGMIVGHLAIFLWRVVSGRRQRSEYKKVAQAEVAEGQEDAEALLAPPVYEEAPAYEDAVDEKQ